MAWGDQVDYMETKGRAPSNAGMRFRTRPGAPLADPTQNKGAINSTRSSLAGTSPSVWNEMFRNRLTGNNPLAPQAPTSGVPHVDSALSQITGTPWGTNNDFNPSTGAPDGSQGPVAPAGPTAPPSLETLAAGGPTHLQSWGSAALTSPGAVAAGNGFQTGNPLSILNKYQTKGTTASYT